ncbi:hypothetical protein BpHYR1_025245 [Brachionus plicatilis]|uniref:Uncharacterized protein n=1 Tax=Brachionus plicatilis TaxID=10195 RepID=A0A3M7PPN3_BRAPC|nr:hypothetical protein BpHYR1_025245 [Brachionus plicatilis]
MRPSGIMYLTKWQTGKIGSVRRSSARQTATSLLTRIVFDHSIRTSSQHGLSTAAIRTSRSAALLNMIHI